MAVPLMKVMIIRSINTFVINIDNFKESTFNKCDSEVLSIGSINRPVVVSIAIMSSISFQIEDLSVEGSDSPKISINFV